MKRKSLLLIVGVFLIGTIFIGMSYGYWMYSNHQEEKNLAMTQCIDITMTDESEGITIEKGIPVSDQEGKSSKPFTFTITNTCNNAIAYNVNLEVLEEESFPFHYMDVQLDNNDFKALDLYDAVDPTYKDDEYEATDSFALATSILGAHESKTHNVRMWIDKDTPEDAQGKSLLNKITVSATNIKDVKSTPKILAYQGDKLLKEINSGEENTEDTIYSGKEVTFRLSGYDNSNAFYYSLSEDGEKIKIEDGTLTMMPTVSGLTLYFYLEDEFGGMSENYTKVYLTLPKLDTIDYQMAAGTSISLDEIIDPGLENVVYGESSDSEILTIENKMATAKKGGTVEISYSTVDDGAVGTIRFRVSEITIEQEKGFILVGNSKKIGFHTINANDIEISNTNPSVAKARIENGNIVVTPISAGDTTIRLKDENGYAKDYQLKVASVSMSPNGKGYLIDNNTVTITTNVSVLNAENVTYGWSNSNKDIPSNFEALNENVITMENALVGSHYIWLKLTGNEEEEVYISKPFSVYENEIVIVPENTDPTRYDYGVEILYPSTTLVESRKVGFGKTLAEAMDNLSSNTTFQVSENGYIYAEAVDGEGNKSVATLQISNIDKVGPVANNIQVNKKNENEATIEVTGILDEANNADGYFVTLEDREPSLEEYIDLTKDSFEKTVQKSGTYYIWLKDNLGNTSKFEANVQDIIEPIHNVSFEKTYVALGDKKNLNLTYEGQYKEIQYSSSDEDVVRISDQGEVTALKPGTSTVTVTFTNHNGQEEIVSAPVYVTSVFLSRNFEALKIGEERVIKIETTNAGEITLEMDNSAIADFEVNGDTLLVRSKSAGIVNLMVKESNGGAETGYCLSVVDVQFNENGGSYQMPSSGSGKLETTILLDGYGELSYAWSNSNSLEPTDFVSIANREKVTKNDSEGSINYYLWVKVEINMETLFFVSNAFILMEDEIVITPSLSGYTNDPYDIAISYPEQTDVTTRKAGFGETLEEAINNAKSASAPTTNINVSRNGYLYVEAKDSFGNLITLTHEIANFDDITPPVITGGSETYINNRTISIETAGTANSGVKEYEYYISTLNETPNINVEATGITSNSVTITDEGPNYIWYRTVSNGGTKSNWSNMQVANIYYKAISVTYTNDDYSNLSNVQEALDGLY